MQKIDCSGAIVQTDKMSLLRDRRGPAVRPWLKRRRESDFAARWAGSRPRRSRREPRPRIVLRWRAGLRMAAVLALGAALGAAIRHFLL